MRPPPGSQPPPWSPADGGGPGGPWEIAALSAVGAVGLVGGGVWAAGQVAGLVFGGGWPEVSPTEVGAILLRLPGNLGDPAQAWPPAVRTTLPGPPGLYSSLAVVIAAIATAAWGLATAWRRARGDHGPERGAAWARRGQLRDLVVDGPAKGRLTLGRVGHRLVAAEGRQSAIVVAPSQSLKTTGLAVPAVLEWEGPVLATSVKSDLLRDTLARRRELGSVWVYDPTQATGIPSSGWSPLSGCGTWSGAQRTAAWLTSAAQPARNTLTDGDFWYAAAAKLLAPLLFAAAASDRRMADIVRWVDTHEESQVQHALEDAGVPDALVAAEATWRRDDRQRSSIYTTAETALAAYADPLVLATTDLPDITADALLDGGCHALYLCAPAHEQRRLQPLFATLVQQIVAAAYERSSKTGKPLDPALLLVLDEAANIAPLRDLDALASTGAGQGIQLLTVFQDLAQVRERWGQRAGTIVNNHRAKIIGSGTSDPDTLDYVARVLGDQEIQQTSSTAGRYGERTQTRSTTHRPLAPANVIREGRPGEAVLVYGHLPPARLRLRPWFADRRLRRLATPAP